jgi:O-antigen chain-terminating methyltransferase
VGFFDGCANVLDIGCGQGYFLDLAHDRSIGAYGIDLGDEAVRACNEKGRKAIRADALRHVSSLRDSSLDGVFIAHVVEHLSPNYLISLVGIIKRKMKPGSYLVIATPNSLNLCTSSCSFYLDPTHVTHIHPDYLEFLLTANSFQVQSKQFYQPTIPADVRLEKIDVNGAAGEVERRTLEKLNRNIDRLNDLIYGNRDFAIVAKKQGGKT